MDRGSTRPPAHLELVREPVDDGGDPPGPPTDDPPHKPTPTERAAGFRNNVADVLKKLSRRIDGLEVAAFEIGVETTGGAENPAVARLRTLIAQAGRTS